MPKYNIHIDRKLPGPEQIARHKDFKKLYGDYQSATRFSFWRELRTKPRYFASLVMIIAVGALVWKAFQQDFAPIRPLINAPFSQSIPYQSANLAAAEGGNIKVGMVEFSVPPLAWVDTSNSPVSDGEVRLSYRVLHTPEDFFFAGVPLQIAQTEGADGGALSGAEGNYLEASPIVELRAFKGDEPVRMREGISVMFHFEGQAKDSLLESYWLDEENRGWVLYQKPQRERLLDEPAILASLPPRPRLRKVQSDEVPIEELRPKGVGAPTIAPKTPNREAYQRKLKAWEADRDATFEAARKRSPIRISVNASRLGYFALGQKIRRRAETQAVKLINAQGERLGPSLDEAQATVFIYEPAVSTLRPCEYNGEGRHIIQRYTRDNVFLWMRLPDGSLGVVEVEKNMDDAVVISRNATEKSLLSR
ncbi:MAG: hypothetical protein AB8F95_05920 [Bacteroidia bacterium]